ncbi:MAG: hypothetical protein V4622_11345 [Bacteroidota bacterium]
MNFFQKIFSFFNSYFEVESEDKDLNKQHDSFNFKFKNDIALSEMVIDEDFNVDNLKELARLNNIDLQIFEGWYGLVIKLIIELEKLGWDRKVSCIKEKYGYLEFYTDDKYDDLVELFKEKSQYVCEDCGEKGKSRHIGFYVSCRTHYLKRVGKIYSTEDGFFYEDVFYVWNKILKAELKTLNTKKNGMIIIEFNEKISNSPLSPSRLCIHNYVKGYSFFLSQIPKNIEGLDYNEINKNFKNPEDCEICGFKAIYNSYCECCENDKWESKENNIWTKDEYVKYNQLDWEYDTKGILTFENSIYQKAENYTRLYNNQELEDHIREESLN